MAELQREIVGVPDSTVTEPLRGRVSIKFLKNLGNFENVTVEFELEDSRREGESADQLLDRLYEKADQHLGKRMREIVKDYRS